MSNYRIITTPTYRGFPINADPTKPCRSDILDGLIGLFEQAFAARKRNMFLRIDLTMPDGWLMSDYTTPFGTFIDSFVKNRKREGHGPCLLWCREQNEGRLPHWHIAMLVSCRETLSFMQHLQTAERLWGKRFGSSGKGLVDYCMTDKNGNPQRNGIMLDMGDPGFGRDLQLCIHWASYLAKTKTKGRGGLGTREWGSKQLDPTISPQLWPFLPLPAAD